ncbi:succinate dehydrogenase, hydrophobic membrane anchor protein [Crenothrix polyspora]|uniref:Succinate dehydrogenase hydrophobic membrane anchor subunit n=1 Tax=Crenothrix polyspora TaxID=360316 RepID=A0A1R4H3E8_9GAMM|nr:succinate dehydrogenase, hydrophobic membrane anchor protein [Crenothrix polyspora]SJM90762.1 Succinate dehydrogenase, hydrophobic membrane anchor protein [Crenothrix polyspora]
MLTKLSLSQIINLGFAKNGTGHWWLQRVSAVALVPLSYFIIRLFEFCNNAPYQQTVDWISFPINALGLMLWLLTVFYHAALGLQVVIEDYVAEQRIQQFAIWGVNVTFLLLGAAALLAVFRIVSAG